MGGETFRQVVSVRFIDPHGQFPHETPAEMDVHYRHCGTLEKNYAVSATFVGQAPQGGGIEKLLEPPRKSAAPSQPRDPAPVASSRIPSSAPRQAGRRARPQGHALGGAKVSEVHGNSSSTTGRDRRGRCWP